MSKNINYYPGLTLSKEEMQFKDYSDKYLSLYVDLIRSGSGDVIFLRDSDNFEMSQGIGSPPKLKIKEGFCLFNGLADEIQDFDYMQTLNVVKFPDQRFFVKSEEKDVDVPTIGISENDIRYVYLISKIVPAAFKCTVNSDGEITNEDGGAIKKSEITSVLRGSNSGAPTRVRFLTTGYEASQNTGVYEVNSVTENNTVVNGTLLEESGTVLCIPIGSFDLGVENNLENRALFGFITTKVVINDDNDYHNSGGDGNDGLGIIRLGNITYSSSTEYTIEDERNNNKYTIAIDVDIDLSNFVTLSTNQTITGEKYFRNLIQGRVASLNSTNHLQSKFININVGGGANDFIFDCQDTSGIQVGGFRHSGKLFGINPLNNIVPGTAIRIRFINVGANNEFVRGSVFGEGSVTDGFRLGGASTLDIKEDEVYTIRYEGEINDANIFSLSPMLNYSSDLQDMFHSEQLLKDADAQINLHAITYNSITTVTITVIIKANVSSVNTKTNIIPIGYRPGYTIAADSHIGTSISCQSNGNIELINDTIVTAGTSVSYTMGATLGT